uniref:Uncharacterized protein n=1 Tax=Tanacetum cinerariifolium TaxID=118510 RepID=A0A699HAT6_TANCI|nr:hypothetical protein [Tanacetum cinerariifolium]
MASNVFGKAITEGSRLERARLAYNQNADEKHKKACQRKGRSGGYCLNGVPPHYTHSFCHIYDDGKIDDNNKIYGKINANRTACIALTKLHDMDVKSVKDKVDVVKASVAKDKDKADVVKDKPTNVVKDDVVKAAVSKDKDKADVVKAPVAKDKEKVDMVKAPVAKDNDKDKAHALRPLEALVTLWICSVMVDDKLAE